MLQNKSFTEGKILSPLIKFALPVLFALFLQTMYGAMDMLIVGQFGTAADVSAVSTGSFVLQTITTGIMGISMGTTILLGRKIGEKRTEDAGNVIGASLLIFLIIGIAITVIMQFCAAPIATILKAPAEAYESTVSYTMICSGGILFIIAYNLIGSIFRGIGNSKLPLLTVAIACVFNIAGDLLLVGVFGMKANGAAVATVAAQAVSVVISLIIIKKTGLPFPFSCKCIRFNKAIIKNVMILGTPIALQDVLVSISFLAITAIVNGLGVIVSAGVGIAEKLCGFIMLIPSAYMQSISAFVAQNMGAGKPERAKKSLLYAIFTSLAVGVIIAFVTFFFGDKMAFVFAGDKPEVIAAAAEYLKAYAIDCLLVSVMFCAVGYFNGCGKTGFVMVQGIVGAFFVRIPVSYFMSKIIPISLFKIGLATPASTVVQILLCTVYFIYLEHRRRKSQKLGG